MTFDEAKEKAVGAEIKTIKGGLWFVCPNCARKLALLTDCANSQQVFTKCPLCGQVVEFLK